VIDRHAKLQIDDNDSQLEMVFLFCLSLSFVHPLCVSIGPVQLTVKAATL
jgi:hypothetical protein